MCHSDECWFSKSSDVIQQLIWHESGSTYSPEYIHEKNQYGTCSIGQNAMLMTSLQTDAMVTS